MNRRLSPSPVPSAAQPHSARGPRMAADAVEGQLALRIVAHLQRGADAVPHDVAERLRVARERALAAAVPARAAVAADAPAIALGATGVALAVGRSGRSLPGGLGGSGGGWWWRFASVLPLALLVAGLVMIDQHNAQEQIDAAAQIDAELLGDPLPPQVYRDPGFVEFARLLEGT